MAVGDDTNILETVIRPFKWLSQRHNDRPQKSQMMAKLARGSLIAFRTPASKDQLAVSRVRDFEPRQLCPGTYVNINAG